MPSYEYTGADPIEHFWAGHVEPGDVVEFTDEPAGPWKPSKKKPTAASPGDPREELPAEEPAGEEPPATSGESTDTHEEG